MRSPKFLGTRAAVPPGGAPPSSAFASMIERLLPPDFRAQIEKTIGTANASMEAIQTMDRRLARVEAVILAVALHLQVPQSELEEIEARFQPVQPGAEL